MQAIRQDEIENYWRVPGTPGHEERERFAGEVFPLARPYIGNTTLWQVVKRMPKGALLHAHLTAMLPYEKIVETIIDTKGMVISASQPLVSDEAKRNASIAFAHNNHTLPANQSSIDDASYVPNTQIPVKQAVEDFAGGKEGFLDFIKNKTSILPEDSIRHELGVDEVWRRFQAFFGPAGTLIEYEPVVRTFFRKLFENLAGDGINWVEIRAKDKDLIPKGDEDPDPNPDKWWHVLIDEMDKFKATEKGKNFWGTRFIWSDSRSKDRARITNGMPHPSIETQILQTNYADLSWDRYEKGSREEKDLPKAHQRLRLSRPGRPRSYSC